MIITEQSMPLKYLGYPLEVLRNNRMAVGIISFLNVPRSKNIDNQKKVLQCLLNREEPELPICLTHMQPYNAGSGSAQLYVPTDFKQSLAHPISSSQANNSAGEGEIW